MKNPQFAFIDHESSGEELSISEMLDLLRRNIRLMLIFSSAASNTIPVGSASLKKRHSLSLLLKRNFYGSKGCLQ